MGIMDKTRDAAQKAAASVQQAAQQGQAKLEAYQASKESEDALFQDLGRAFYDEQRNNGSRDAVIAALNKVDAARATPAQGEAAAVDPPADGDAPTTADGSTRP